MPWTGALNSVFSDYTEITLVPPLDKGASEKNEVSNLRPVSVLTTFSKVYEKIAKWPVEADMN